MKKLAVLLVAIGALASGCVAVPVGDGPAYRDSRAHDGRAHDRRMHQRDQDRDGVPDRVDRDRDGDGVRNSQDRRPDDPRRN